MIVGKIFNILIMINVISGPNVKNNFLCI